MVNISYHIISISASNHIKKKIRIVSSIKANIKESFECLIDRGGGEGGGYMSTCILDFSKISFFITYESS